MVGRIKPIKLGKYLDTKASVMDIATVENIISCSPETKCSVVLSIMLEKGLRRILNYGHTAGHAIEQIGGYKIPHGECVAMGMMVAGRIALEYGYPREDFELQRSALMSLGSSIKIPEYVTKEAIIENCIIRLA